MQPKISLIIEYVVILIHIYSKYMCQNEKDLSIQKILLTRIVFPTIGIICHSLFK